MTISRSRGRPAARPSRISARRPSTLIRGSSTSRRKRRRRHQRHPISAASASASATSAAAPVRANASSTPWISPLKSMPRPRNSPVHSAAARSAKTAKRRQVIASAPAIGAATTETPGTNFAATSDMPPQRVISASLCRTHESGDSEIRHSSRSTRWPWRRPPQNHTASPVTLARSDTPKVAAAEKSPAIDSPPATTISGAAGSGAPTRDASVTANTISMPWWSSRATSSLIPTASLPRIANSGSARVRWRSPARRRGSATLCAPTDGAAMRSRLPMHVINGLGVALGVGLVEALVHAAAGPHAAALAMTGAIYASLADLPLRPERNWRHVAAGALMGLGAAALMLLTRPHVGAQGATIALITFVAMMMLGWGPRAGPASFAAVLSIVFTMGMPAGQPVGEALGWQAVGAGCCLLWSSASSVALQPRYRRLALAAALQASARLLRARIAVLRGERSRDDEALRAWVRSEAQLAERLQLARDLLFAAAPSAGLQRQIAVLLRLIDLRDLLLASSLDVERLGDDAPGRQLRARFTDRLERLAQALDQE